MSQLPGHFSLRLSSAGGKVGWCGQNPLWSTLPSCCCWHVGSQQLRFPTSLPAFLANTCAQASSSSRAIQSPNGQVHPSMGSQSQPAFWPAWPLQKEGGGRCRGQRNIPATSTTSTPVCKHSWIRCFVQLEILEGATKKNILCFVALICKVSISCRVHNVDSTLTLIDVWLRANYYDTSAEVHISAGCR